MVADHIGGDDEIARELEKSLDSQTYSDDNISNEIAFLGHESFQERRKKIHEFLHRHDRVTLPACADCQRECKLKAPAGADITLICKDWVPAGETK